MQRGLKKPRYTTEEFIKKAQLKHGGKYDYSLTVYTGSRNNVKIICPEHGVFEQNPAHHLSGRGCRLCYLNRPPVNKKTPEEFICDAKRIHGDKYDYSLVDYNGSTETVKIICPEHGVFEQNVGNHINSKTGCPICGDSRKTTEEFICDARKVHGNRYDYSLVDYKNSFTKIKIICPEHGVFEQIPSNHLLGHGCSKCFNNFSKGEKEIFDYIKSFYSGTIIENDKSLIKPYELDIYIPDKKIAFEFNGLYWHSQENGKDRNYHLNKTNLCKEKGVQLIHIFEDEWHSKQNIVKSRIKHLLGETPYRIYARKCVIKNITPERSKHFLEKYHIQGNYYSKINLGLFYKDKLVALMTFNSSRFNKKYNWELLRYVTVSNFSILGGASKLLSHFRKNYTGSIISYADKRWSNGNLYKQLGFKELSDSYPNYFYFKRLSLIKYSRNAFQKHKLKDKLEIFDENLTEYENMKNNGYNRIWDCGNKVFVLD